MGIASKILNTMSIWNTMEGFYSWIKMVVGQRKPVPGGNIMIKGI